MIRMLQECRIRGVITNIPFLLNVLTNPTFETGIVTTSFIDQNPELKMVSKAKWNFADKTQRDLKSTSRFEKILRYLGNLSVNGHPPELGVDVSKLDRELSEVTARLNENPEIMRPQKPTPLVGSGIRSILVNQGPKAYAKFVRSNPSLMITDTTWRDAHQSLLA